MSESLVITLGIIVFFIFSVLWSMLFNKHPFIRLICIGAAAVAAFISTLIIKKIINTPERITEITSSIEELAKMMTLSENLTSVICSLVSALIAPLIFILLFFIFLQATYIVRAVLSVIFKIISKKGKKKKMGKVLLFSFICGAAYTLIFTFCTLVPVSAYLDTATAAIPLIESLAGSEEGTQPDSPATVTVAMTSEATENPPAEPSTQPESSLIPGDFVIILTGSIREANDAPLLKAYKFCGGNLFNNALTSIKIEVNGERIKTNLAKETDAVAALLENVVILTKTKPADYTDSERAVLESFGTTLKQTKLVSVAASELIYLATDSWSKGEPFIGIAQPELGEEFAPLMNTMVKILHEDAKNIDYLCDDVNTFGKLISDISKVSSSLPEGAPLTDALLSSGFIRTLLTDIGSNPRMRPLIPEMANVGLEMIGAGLGLPPSADAALDTLAGDAASCFTTGLTYGESALADALCNKLLESFNNLGINGITDADRYILAHALVMSTYDISNSNDTELIKRRIRSCIDALTMQTDGSNIYAASARELMQALNEIRADAVLSPEQKEDAFNDAIDEYLVKISRPSFPFLNSRITDSATLSADISKKSYDTVMGLTASSDRTLFKYTIESIRIDTDKFSDSAVMTDDAVNGIVDTVSAAFESLTSLLSNTEQMGTQDICTALGRVLDAFDGNELLYGKEKTETLLTVLLNSPLVNQKINISATEIDSMLEKKAEKNVSYTALMSSVASTVNVLESIKNGSEISTESVGALLDDLAAEGSGEVIAEIITPDKIASLGMSNEEKSEAAANVLCDVFSSISQIEDETERNKEAAAVKQLIELAIDAAGTQDSNASINAFGDPESSRLGCTADELVDTILSSSTVTNAIETNTESVENPFGVKLTENDISAVTDTLNTKIAQADNQTDKDTLIKLGTFLGVDVGSV